MVEANTAIGNYTEVWHGILGIVNGHLAAGETSLSRVVRLTEAEWRRMDLKISKGVALGKEVRMPRSAMIGARQSLRMRTLASVCQSDTSMVVELGSGWGNNLLDFWLNGAPRDARYFALEPTSSGRECTELLAALEPRLDLEVLHFDFHQPHYSALPRGNPHVVVLTSHAIEQIPELREEVVIGLLDLGRAVTCVHFEPIGWQIAQNQSGVGSTREYSETHNYNRNLWPLLSHLAEQDRISIDMAVPDILHHKRDNASSLVIWHSR